MQKINRKKLAFTLIELSIVILIIGSLAAIILGSKSLVAIGKVSTAIAMTLDSQITSITGMVAWYESSLSDSFPGANEVNGTAITYWYNREPSTYVNKNILVPNGSNNTFNASGINNIPDVSFSGTKPMVLSIYSASSWNASTFVQGPIPSPTVIIVFRPNTLAVNTTYNILDSAISSSTCSIAIKNPTATSSTVILNAGSSVGVTPLISFAAGGSYILATTFNAGSSYVFVNTITGVKVGSSVGTNNLNGLTIGNGQGASTGGVIADIAEVIVYNRVLNSTELQDVMSYLSKKYKITVTGL